MDSFIALPTLAGLALVLTTVISVIGVRSDFRDKNSDKLKPAGYLAIVLTIAVAGIGLVSIVGDALGKRDEKIKSTAEIADLRQRLERPLLPLAALQVNYAIDVTRSSIGNGNTGCQPFIPMTRSSIPGKWNKRWLQESGITEALNPPDVDIEVFSKPIDLTTFHEGVFEGEPAFSLRGEEAGTSQASGVWEGDCGKEVGFFSRARNPVSSSGAIQSTMQLVGTQIVIIVTQENGSDSNPVHPKLKAASLSMAGRNLSSISRDWKSFEVSTTNVDSTKGRTTLFSHVLTAEELRNCCLIQEN